MEVAYPIFAFPFFIKHCSSAQGNNLASKKKKIGTFLESFLHNQDDIILANTQTVRNSWKVGFLI